MAEASSKGQSAFYRHVILPSKSYKEKQQISVTAAKNNASKYEKQNPLRKAETDSHRSTLERQLSVEMLRQGFHQSFGELRVILAWQKEDRARLGAEHPLYRRPLLDAEPEKLRFLCTYLNKVEEAKRRHRYSIMYKNYLELASFFSKTDDYWLSDSFYEKCLVVAKTNSQLDPQFAAEAYLNVGLAYERRGELMKALDNFEQYRQLSEDYYRLKSDANLQLTRLYLKLAERRSNENALGYILQAHDAATKSDDDKVHNETSYKLGQAYLQHGQIDAALTLLHQYYDYCRSIDDDEGFGQVSEALAICYQKKGNVEKSIGYLTKYLAKVSDRENDLQYARAYSALGQIQTTLGQHDLALQSLSRGYTLSLANKHVDLDRHRVLYGIANGSKLRQACNDRIAQIETDELLEWKCIRTERSLTK